MIPIVRAVHAAHEQKADENHVRSQVSSLVLLKKLYTTFVGRLWGTH
jgi:hypothetical protein